MTSKRTASDKRAPLNSFYGIASEGMIIIYGQRRVIGKTLVAVDGGGVYLVRQTG